MARPDTRRWLIVAALFVVTYCISTPLAAYGVFLPVLAEHFGWSRGAIHVNAGEPGPPLRYL